MRRISSDPVARRARGFTLVEMVVAITLIGILAMVTVPLLQLPVSAHLDTARRATLASELDVTVARLREDFATALPGSVRLRQVGARYFLEYLEVRASGRYRSAPASPAVLQSCPATCSVPNANDTMEFVASCMESCFTSLGPLDGGTPVAGSDWVVIAPTAASPYAAAQRSRLQGLLAVTGGRRVTMTPHNFPLAAANKRFYVVATPVTYDCNPATRRLTRHSSYAITALQPINFPGAVSAPLATNVSLCDPPRIDPTIGGVLVSIRLRYDRPVTGLGAGSTEAAESFSEFGVRELP